jgi:hypothetical protein
MPKMIERVAEKNLIAGCSKSLSAEASEKSTLRLRSGRARRRRIWTVRRSETIERSEAYDSFSAAASQTLPAAVPEPQTRTIRR